MEITIEVLGPQPKDVISVSDDAGNTYVQQTDEARTEWVCKNAKGHPSKNTVTVRFKDLTSGVIRGGEKNAAGWTGPEWSSKLWAMRSFADTDCAIVKADPQPPMMPIMIKLFCTIDQQPIPLERKARRGYAAVTCSDTCYQEFRKRRKKPTRGQRVTPEEWRYVMQIRRAKARGLSSVTVTLSEQLGTAKHEAITEADAPSGAERASA